MSTFLQQTGASRLARLLRLWRVTADSFADEGIVPVRQTPITLTNERIKTLPTIPIVIFPATQTPNYATSLTKVPHIIGGWILASNYQVGYTNRHADAAFGVFLGSDSVPDIGSSNLQCVPIMRGQTTVENGDGYAAIVPGRFSIVDPSPNPIYMTALSGAFENNFYDNALVFGLDNHGNGNLTGGHATNTLKIMLLTAEVSI
jgi:hypothetical protein